MKNNTRIALSFRVSGCYDDTINWLDK